MRLVVFVPLVAGVDFVEVSRFPRPILVLPTVCLWVRKTLFDVEKFFFFLHILLRFSSEHGFGGKVRIDRGLRLL